MVVIVMAQNNNGRMIIPSKSKRTPMPRGIHTLGTFHLHSVSGACMCTAHCCHSIEHGCICRSCSGVGHVACVAINADRRKAAKRRGVASSMMVAIPIADDAIADDAIADDAIADDSNSS
jgi:hypothetical protein